MFSDVLECETSDFMPISDKPCKCASDSSTNECEIGKYCWDNYSCEASAKEEGELNTF